MSWPADRRTAPALRGVRFSDGARVEVLDGNLEGALRELKKRTERAGLVATIKRHAEALSPGQRRRRKRRAAAQLRLRAARRAAARPRAPQ